jgi:hypothetical protein
LLSNGRNYQFVILLSNGRAASVSAPATAGVFTHVAATYDGTDLRLYLNGTLAAHGRIKGVLSNGAGPLLMGNDALDRRIDGTLDSVFFSTAPSSDADIAHLACLPHPSNTGGDAHVEWAGPARDLRELRSGADQQQLRLSAVRALRVGSVPGSDR